MKVSQYWYGNNYFMKTLPMGGMYPNYLHNPTRMPGAYPECLDRPLALAICLGVICCAEMQLSAQFLMEHLLES